MFDANIISFKRRYVCHVQSVMSGLTASRLAPKITLTREPGIKYVGKQKCHTL